MSVLTHDHLLSILSYDERSGNFVWLINSGRARIGNIAGNVHSGGYVVIIVDKKQYKAHRLAWFYVTGEWPRGRLDHKDNCGSNNRWDNLRPATHSQNMANRKLNANNSCGHKGVVRRGSRYRAYINKDGKRYNLGTFSTAEEAAAVSWAKAQELHGSFARRA